MKNLFKSQTSYGLLDLLLANPGKFFYLNELTKTLSKDPANLLRELAKLQSEGLVLLKNENDKKYYGLDEKSPIIPELKALFSKLQTSDFDRKFKTEWMLGEDIPNIDPFFSKIWLDCFVNEFAKVGGQAYKKIAAIFRDYHLWFYYDEKDANEVGEHLVNKMAADPKFMDLINENIVRTSDELRDFVSKLPEDRLEKLSNEKLWSLYRQHEDIHNEYYQWGWIPVAADMFCNNLTERGKKMLRDIGVPEDKINEYLTTLNQPANPSLMKIEQDELAKIGIKVQKDPKQFALFKNLFKKFKEEEVKLYGLYEHHAQYEERFEKYLQNLVGSIRPDIINDLQNHYTKYFYNKFLFTEEQGIYNFEFYLKSLVRLVNSEPDIQKTIIKDKAETAKLLYKRDELIKQLKLNPDQKRFFIAWGEFMVTKIYRRYAQLYAIYRMIPIIEEIANRLGLSIKQTKFMTTEEIHKALFEGVYDAEEIKKRVAFSVYYADTHEHTFYIGEQAQKALELVQKETISQVTEIHGQCGCQGVARGIVKIVNVIADMDKVKPGDILVSISTQPDLVPAMKKAAGFVTNQGGVTSHAAIVAREMNKPCVIGTKIATKVLKDGMEVEVDATKGVVRIIKSELTTDHGLSDPRGSDLDQKFKTDWMLAEDIPNMDPFFFHISANCFVNDFAKAAGRAYRKVATVHRDYHLWFYYDAKDAFEVGEHLVDKMDANPEFMNQINQNIIRFADQIRTFGEALPEDHLDKLSNEQLWRLYRKHEEIDNEFYQWCWIPAAVDMFCNNLTERGKKILRGLGAPEDKINEYLTILNQPAEKSLMQIEQDDLAAIGIKVQKDPKQSELFKDLFRQFKEEEVKLYGLYEHHAQHEERFEKYLQNLVGSIRPDIISDLQKHYTKYFHTKFLFTEEQGVYSFEHYLKALVRLVNSDPDIQATLKEDDLQRKQLQVKRAALISELKLDSDKIKFFTAWGDFMITKIYRRYAQIYTLYRMVPIIEEIGNRLGLTIKQTKFMTSDETQKALKDGTLDAEEIKKRVSFSVHYSDAQGQMFYTGEQAQKALEFLQKETIGQVTEIQGQCGCQGVVRGIVKIVNVIADMDKVKPGDILVSISTQPDLVPAMKKAAGFVTNQGGVTSHAAIVAREMNKPCVIGTKIATKVLKDGMEVEVDATKGVVRIIKS